MTTEAFARRMRAEPTDAEFHLWQRLRRGQLGARFRRQVVIGPFVADFVCLSRRLIVECDGSQHFDSPYDRARDARLAGAGFRVLRFWNDAILADTESVCAAIQAALAQAPLPRPPRAMPAGWRR
jgi:very-short-patch-repair endonuclease